MATYEEWKHVCSLLIGNTDPLSEKRSFRHKRCLSKVQAVLLLCVQMAYKGLAALVSPLTCLHIFHEPYDRNEAMTKYIFVQFNVSPEE